MQFVGAITIIADIIGPERIRRFGAALQSTVTSVILLRYLQDCFKWYTVIFRQTLMKDYPDEATDSDQFKPSQLDLLNYLIALLLTIFTISSIDLPNTGFFHLLEVFIIFVCLVVSVSPLVTVLTIILLILSGLAINSLFIKPLAWTLEHPSLDRLSKITSLCLLLLGFHFELLAS